MGRLYRWRVPRRVLVFSVDVEIPWSCVVGEGLIGQRRQGLGGGRAVLWWSVAAVGGLRSSVLGYRLGNGTGEAMAGEFQSGRAED